jgi:hypothetical protein
MQFPSLDAKSLLGVTKRLPDDLPAERTLLLLAFRQWQQRQVDAWIVRAAEAGWAPDLSTATGPVRGAVIEVPCLARHWSIGRAVIDGGMARSIGIPEVLARTWTAYTDVGRVQRALGIASSDNIWVGVLAPTGDVVVEAFGDPTPASWDAVAQGMA